VYGLKENVLEGDGEYRSSFQEEEGFDVEAYYEEEEEDEEDRSLDLLARFIHHMFKKISRKARKAARTILPSAISPQLVVCTLGSVVFVTILLLRLIWSAVGYMQKGGKTIEFHGENGYSSYNASQPAT